MSEPDVEIAVAVRAAEVRFECRPEVDVRVHASSLACVESLSERENLPEELEPGVTYRDLAVHWRVAARLVDGPQVPGDGPARERPASQLPRRT